MHDHSPHSSATKLHRAASTKTHISSLMPLHHHSSPSSRSPYHPNTRQADISRLLDPAYASSSSASTHSSSGNVRAYTRAYVDHSGEMHDPDYRDFPVLPTRLHTKQLSSPRRSSSTHSRVSTSASNANRPDRYKTYPLVARPEWERGWSTEVEDLDEEDEAPSSSEGGLRSPFTPSSSSSERTPSSRRASLPPSVYAYTPSTYFFSEPVSTTSSPVDSLEEEQEARERSPFDDDMVEEEPRYPGNTSRTAASILRKMKRSSSASVPAVPTRPSEEDGEDKETHEMHLVAHDDDEVYVSFTFLVLESTLTSFFNSPSCTYILSRKLRAFNLRLRFGVFHAKRRLSITRRRQSSS